MKISDLFTERVNVAVFVDPEHPDAGCRTEGVMARTRGEWAMHRPLPKDNRPVIVQWNVSHVPTETILAVAPNMVTGEQALRRLEPIHITTPDEGALALVATALAGLNMAIWIGDSGWFSPLHLVDLLAWTRESA